MSSSVPRLDSLVPEMGFRSPDDALDAFLGWCADSGLRLYAHQEEAILELFAGHHVVLDTPTGSGKSLVATALHFKTFAETGRSWYTAPIKALVSEKFFTLCKQFGPEFVGMATGDGALNRGAPIVACTAEILANLALREGESAAVASAVMDEFHYYADRDRGSAWQIPLLTLPRTQLLLLSATLGDTLALREDLAQRTGRRVVEVKGAFRPVPLSFTYSQKPEHEAIADVVRSGRGPVYVVHFTQSAAAEQAQALTSTDWCTKDEKKVLQEALRGFRFTSPYGPTVRRYLQMGIGLHHAGLLPRYRLLCEKLAQQGLLKVICGTDTLGVGINVPIRTVLFTQLCKYDGERVDILKVRDFRQIAGRAGRAGFDTAGYVLAQAPAHIIENLRAAQKAEGDPKKLRKLVKAQPPERGYKHWDETTFNGLVEKPCERLEPRLSIDHGRLLMAMQHAQDVDGDARGGVERLRTLVTASHQTAAEKTALLATIDTLVQSLVQAGVVHEQDGRLLVAPGLQQDFSLHHSLSLFLVGALERLDPDAPTYPLDVLSWVESILENPKAVLERQQSREYQRRLNELKAAGVPYEERIAQLEDVTYPKPLAAEIYEVFNAYAATHPWVEGEGIRPKGVAREMAESFQSFSDYVKDLGLQRGEGVLLRYLSDVYRALVQNVPAELQTEPFLDLVAWLRATLAVVDSSLITEWETLARGEDAPLAPETPRVADISQDRRTFHARVRAELHALVRALAQRDWEEAADSVRRASDGPWSPADFEGALAPFLDAFGDVAFDHRARLSGSTIIRQEAPHQWIVRQRLHAARPAEAPDTWGFTDEDDTDEGTAWGIEARIDLRSDTNPDGPILEVVAIGA